jgi:2-succinyl-5-enolpyruvyl-6-hydroxy-3-cyclohexene-1-carboxylate synthase
MSTRIEVANRNTLWATALVDSLAQQGVAHAVIGAGSRSAPLALAFAAHPHVRAHSFIDERSGGFFGLGIAKSSGQPVALVCTSGTAGANFFPAVIEANSSGIPLIVLTADRPPDLRESGANQTIDQLKIYGDHVRWFHEVALPEMHTSQHLLRYLRTLGARAVLAAQGGLPGPVHLNLPFRPPLEPTPVKEDIADWRADNKLPPSPVVQSGYRHMPSEKQANGLLDQIEAHPHGLIVCGPDALTNGHALMQLAHVSGYPVLADGLSGLRFGEWSQSAGLLTHYNSYLGRMGAIPASLVIQLGNMPTSKRLNAYLAGLPYDAERIWIDPQPRWQDDSFRITHVLQAEPLALISLLADAKIGRKIDPDWLTAWVTIEAHARNVAEQHLPQLEARAIDAALDALPEGGNLMVSNSLPVRHLDDFGRPRSKRLHAFANRGASGIDGAISTAAGIAVSTEQPSVLVTGDLAFLHDLGGLLALKRLGIPLVIVVINNDGGAIFERLPVREFDPPYTELFQTPHGLTFSHSAAQFGLTYARTDNAEDIAGAIQQALKSKKPTLIEVPSNGKSEEAARQAFLAEVNRALEAAG